MQIPLLRVDTKFFDLAESSDENADPPLAILFKRIGTGGTALSDADYVYSVIKHRIPDAYELVEGLHGEHNISSLLSATDLVMTAVRLAAFDWIKPDGKATTDWESPKKQQFNSLLREGDSTNNFLNHAFLPMIKADEGTSESKLASAFSILHELLKYQDGSDPGLPIYALPSLSRQLIQVLLRWVIKGKISDIIPDKRSDVRSEILRFVMFWLVCVNDNVKASLFSFEEIAKSPDFNSLGKQIYDRLINEKVAFRIISPDSITSRNKRLVSSGSDKLLRGRGRFTPSDLETEIQKEARNLYSRWWNKAPNHHQHPILLWLQRELANTFKGNPVAGRDDDTPYDYDHICPSDHWGVKGAFATLDPLVNKEKDSDGRNFVGNCIGNLRVWDSSMNRSDGNAAPIEKLDLSASDTVGIEKRNDKLNLSAILICDEHINDWITCSGSDNRRIWDEQRAIAFQRAVENRAFHLYKRYFNELEYSQWCTDEPIQPEIN